MFKKSLLIVFACLMLGFVTLSFAEENQSQCKSVADINGKPKSGYTPLMTAVKNNNMEITKMLIEKGADVNDITINSRESAIFFAVNNDNIEIVKLLISKGADVNMVNAYAQTPLTIAVEKGNKKMINLLLGVKEEK